ncbi:MAG: hypothetical protein KTR16_12230 [Acidiferrobacterales bacterium]|nr:hypothetical protein [Acidiferrobacterales bacterium]
MPAIITINDNNLLIQTEESIARSQGYALLLEDQVIFDFDSSRTAIESCRLQPQQIQNRYWQQCAQTSIGSNTSAVRNSADLVWQHLSAMQDHLRLDKVVFAVPSHYQQDNLQLLLGIANSAGLTAQGLVNKGVLVTQHLAQQDGSYLHIDMQLHQTVCSLIKVHQGVAKLSDIDIISDVSILQIHDALLRKMQQQFIQSDRFDPLHYAETEQQLYDQIADIAKNIALEGKASVTIRHDSQLHSIALDSKHWNSVVEPFAINLLDKAKSNRSAHILMQLNGLFAGIVPPSMNQAGISVVEDTLTINCNLIDADSFNEDGLVYRMELPLLQTKQEIKLRDSNEEKLPTELKIEPATKPQASNGVTHLMQAGLAIPLQYTQVDINAGQLQLSRSSQSNLASMLETQQLFILNDASRNSLQLNDRLGSNHADGVINAIQVLE